jgi:hypothetical protein
MTFEEIFFACSGNFTKSLNNLGINTEKSLLHVVTFAFTGVRTEGLCYFSLNMNLKTFENRVLRGIFGLREEK